MTKKAKRSFRTGDRYQVTKAEEIPRCGYGDAERVFVVRFNNPLRGRRDSIEAAQKARMLAKDVVCEDFDIPKDRRDDLFVIGGDLYHVTVKLKTSQGEEVEAK